MSVKSISLVRAYGAGNNGNWCARLRRAEGAELFAGLGEGWTQATAGSYADANRDNISVGDGSGKKRIPYTPLAAGVTIKA
jgi:hypothetical protein